MVTGNDELLQLKDRILNHGVFWGEHGYPTGYYWDIREVLLNGKWLRIAASQLWQKIKQYDPEVIFGMGVGATPLLSGIQMIAAEDGVELQTLVVREERKDRNRRKHIEGTIPKQTFRGVFIDDMMNQGTTLTKVLNIMKEEQVPVELVACGLVVDRWSNYGSRLVRLKGTPVEYLYTRHDFGASRMDPWIMDVPSNSKIKGKRLFTKKIITDRAWRCLEHNIVHEGTIKSPVTMDETSVYWATDFGKVMCHDLDTGEMKWDYQMRRFVNGKIVNIMHVDDKHIYFNGYDGIARKLDKETGKVIWVNRVCNSIHSASVVDYERNRLYLCTEFTETKGSIVSLDLETGAPLWKYEIPSWIPCTPNIKDGVVVTGTNNNKVYAVRADNGEFLWEQDTSGKIRGQLGFIGSRVCSFDEAGIFRMHDLHTGELLFERCFGKSYHSFVKYDVENHQIVFSNLGANSYIIALDESGHQRWMTQLRGEQLWNPQIKNGKIHSVSRNGYLSTLNAKTGEKVACDFLNYSVASPAVCNDNYLAVNSLTQGLFVYRI